MGAANLETAERRDETLLAELLELWEDSVRATHDFLTDSAIRELKPSVRESLEGAERLTVCRDESGKITAFMGTERGRLAMLFAAPAAIGTEAGGQLVGHAVRDLGVRYVDVNEQNPRAVEFYKRFGFRLIRRSRLDSQGNPFPILHMKLVENPGEADRWVLLPSGILIRPFQPGEAGCVSRLHMQLYESRYGFRGIFEHYVLKGLADFTGSPAGGRLWVALDEKAVIGSIAIVRAEEGVAQLRWFLIREDWQGAGIGKALMDAAMDFVREKGYREVFLWTIQTLETARRLYGKYGFIKTEESTNTEWSGKELIEERWVFARSAYRSITVTEEFRALERMRAEARRNEAAALYNARCEGQREESEKWQKVVEKKDAALAGKDAALADKDAALADKDAALAGKDAEITRLRKLLGGDK
jgi:GNAT superfamily N-acetyltransferase